MVENCPYKQKPHQDDRQRARLSQGRDELPASLVILLLSAIHIVEEKLLEKQLPERSHDQSRDAKDRKIDKSASKQHPHTNGNGQ